MSRIYSKAVTLLVLFAYSLFAQGESDSLNTEDMVANKYIESALAKQPNELPKLDDQYHDMLEALNNARAKLDANQTSTVAKKPASTDIPEIKSIENTSREKRTELYARLSEQTGLTTEQIKALFENPGSHNQQLLKPEPEEDQS